MKKLYTSIFILCASISFAQTTAHFDNAAALQEAINKGIDLVDHAGYVQYKYEEWQKANGVSTPQQNNNIGYYKNGGGSTPTVQSATNADFENGNHNGWQLYVGENKTSSNGPLDNIRTIPAAGPNDTLSGANLLGCWPHDTILRHGLMTPAFGNDPLTGTSLVSPFGGNYVARLNRYCFTYEGSFIEQTFNVTQSERILNYAYQVILQDGGHPQGDQAYYTSYVLDALGDTIPNSFVYIQAANGTTPGFDTALLGWNTYYKSWTPVTLDLSSYIGQNVTLHFRASACRLGGHSGYAYVDVKLDSTSAVANVWPGDANYDLTVNMHDYLYLGWANGATGPVRTAASTAWTAQAMNDWGQITAYGTDIKHADCDGNGTVNANDTMAIFLNYTQTHTFKNGSSTLPPIIQSEYRNLTLNSNSNTVGASQPITLNIDLPASNNPSNDKIYGIAFRLNVPAQFISGLKNNDLSNSIIGTAGDNMLVLCKPFIGQGFIDYCLVRKDHQNSAFAGNLLNVTLNTSAAGAAGYGSFSVSDVKAVTYEGGYLPIGATQSTVYYKGTLGDSPSISLLPNPATDKLSVFGIENSTFNYEISNVIGQTVIRNNNVSSNIINVESLVKGAYFIKVYDGDKTSTEKFIKE